ncbi:MAG: galactokinase [Clostridia bacterium]|nr:galactokinase [Clostridia bacterium]
MNMNGFEEAFGKKHKYVFSAPGRTEIGGNHTDHQRGCVLAGAVDLYARAFVSDNGENAIRLTSRGYAPVKINLSDLSPKRAEKNTTAALVRGVAAGVAGAGAKISGLDIYVRSDVPQGSGLSSSACFEVLLAQIFNGLFYGGRLSPTEIAIIGKRAENIYFGKPSGLMDQAACAAGGVCFMDFKDENAPVIKRVPFCFEKAGYSVCVINTGASHADLTNEYAAVPREMCDIAAFFGKSVLREVSVRDFYANIPALRESRGDRAVLRAMHFFGENERARLEYKALKSGDVKEFIKLVRASGESSQKLLQNITPAGRTREQAVALCLALCEKLLRGEGACRVHGGGFAGTVQAFVPEDRLKAFKRGIEAVFGKGACRTVAISDKGAIREK